LKALALLRLSNQAATETVKPRAPGSVKTETDGGVELTSSITVAIKVSRLNKGRVSSHLDIVKGERPYSPPDVMLKRSWTEFH
jgi:hypothetical protein